MRAHRPFARLVGDDRIALAAAHGRLLARPAQALAGLIEVRGLGIRRLAHEPVAVVGLVVDLAGPEAERLPGDGRESRNCRYQNTAIGAGAGVAPAAGRAGAALDRGRKSDQWPQLLRCPPAALEEIGNHKKLGLPPVIMLSRKL